MSTFSFGFDLDAQQKTEDIHLSWYSELQSYSETLLQDSNYLQSLENLQRVLATMACWSKTPRHQISIVDLLLKVVHGNEVVGHAGVLDVIPGVYEGGLKLWECTFDLVFYLYNQRPFARELNIIELGCGTGILGITAIKLFCPKSFVFLDYNKEVLTDVTWPNISLNIDADDNTSDISCYFGDWIGLLPAFKNRGVDVILAAEVLYTEENCRKIAFFLDQTLTSTSQAILANKRYYFGTRGGSTLFEQYVSQLPSLSVTTVSSVEDGQSNIRDIQVVTRRRPL